MDVKTNLKEAREAIKNKDYKTSLKLCKAVLKEDKSNYMGLVLLGISLQETGPAEQAPLAFRKAIHFNESNLLAWNGLANYYEKFTSPNSGDLIAVYTKILELESNESKIVETIKKMGALEVEEFSSMIQSIYAIGRNDKFAEGTNDEAYRVIVDYLANKKCSDDSILEIYEASFRELLKRPVNASIELYSVYLKLLYKLKRHEILVSVAEKMHETFEQDTISLEWICKVHNEHYVEGNRLVDSATGYCDRLLELYDKSAIGLFTKSIVLYGERNLTKARDCLIEATKLKPGLLHAWIFLTRCYLSLHFYKEAIESAYKADALLKSLENPNLVLCNLIEEYLCLCLCRSSELKDLEEAVSVCLRLNETREGDPNMISSLIRAYINLGNFVQAEMWLDKLESAELKTVLKARLLTARGNLEGALQILERNPDDAFEYWFLLGRTYWNLDKHEKSLIPFLKATKLEQNSYECFLRLGNYYQRFRDLDKSWRCYEKCFEINKRCSAAGIELSKMYRKRKMWDENLNLLKNLTTGKIDVNMKWAYLELGIHYLEKEDYAEAINSLRFVIRVDPENSNCWETLADAYLARGAYTSALKSYQKAVELSPDSLYSLHQIANIKKILGEYAEARKEFENVLSLDGSYTPALKGMAETCLLQARQHHRQQLHGLARDAAQCAVDSITLALKNRNDLACSWKIIADSCSLVAGLPERFSCLMVAVALAEGKDGDHSVILEENELYLLAARCYSKAINLVEENVFLYHDLANCYLLHARKMEDGEERDRLLERALTIANHCVTNNPTHWQHWNVMGNIAFFQAPKNLALAQHSFIKAVTLEHNSAIAWSNLGSVYLHHGDVKLANDAFSQAQRGDPNYVHSWVGQALIAEAAGHHDAMDLFRHSTQLSPHQQGAAGYGYWVCRTLSESPPDAVLYSIHNMHAVPVACDALTWYTENNPTDPCAWNMLGIMRERLGLRSDSARAFKNALLYSRPEQRDHINVNHGRALLASGKYPEAVDSFKNVHEATFNSGSGLALALFKDEQYEESYEAYESALHWLTEEQGFQSDLLVALASMAYLFQGPDAAKTLLLQSTQLKPRSPWGLYATLSLGLLHDDSNLSNLVLKELEEVKDSNECLPHYGLLLSYTYLLQGEHIKALRELSKLVHRHPDQASLWLSLSILLLRLHKRKKVTTVTAKCASVAMKLGQSKMDVTKVLCVVSLASLMAGNYEEGLKAAQSAVHTFPNVTEGWCVFISALRCAKRADNDKIEATKTFIAENLTLTALQKKWLEKPL